MALPALWLANALVCCDMAAVDITLSCQQNQDVMSNLSSLPELKDTSDPRKLEMLKVLQSKECVNLEPLVLNKDSFAETAANISALSVLVKDGLAQVRLASDKSYIIVPRNTTDSTLDGDDTKSIFQLNYKDWELMRQASEGVTHQGTHRNASNWPPLIPKGIRKKARRRACFRNGDRASQGTENLKQEEEASGSVVDNSKLLEAEATPQKPLLTYSRRKKPEIESESMEMAVKRYTRRVLNGEIYVEKTYFFQELVPTKKRKDEGDGLFEKLASAPKRRRTAGHTGDQSGLYAPMSNSPEGPVIAVYRKASKQALEGVQSSDPMIIAPKRFKKTNFRPRQLAIAQIKAKLKAILNRQAPLK